MPIHGITATYQPFSFQERLSPLQMMKEEYDKINEGIALLGEAANQYYQFLDPAAKQEVDAYNATLNNVAGSLASEGMKAVSRNTLNDLRRQYNGRIKHIQEAAQTVGTMQAQIREMQMKDPTLIVQSIPTVSEVLNDPTVRPSVVPGSLLQKEGIAAAFQLPGIEYSDIRRYLDGDMSAIPGIEQSIDKIAKDYGVTTDQARSYISRGIVSGLGERAAQLEQKREDKELTYEYGKKMASFEQGLKNAATQKALDADFLAKGWKVDPTKSNINERYTFDEEHAKKVVGATGTSSRRTTTTTKASTAKDVTEQYSPRKGTIFIDKGGHSFEDLPSVPRGYNESDWIGTNGLKSLSGEAIMKIFDSLNIRVDPYEYMTGSGRDGIDYEAMIDDYRGYLDLYQFKKHVRRRDTKRALENDNYEIIEISQAGTAKKVDKATKEAEDIARRIGTETRKTVEEDEGENDSGE